MRHIFALMVTMILVIPSCSTVTVKGKLTPEYHGVDKRAEDLVNEYLNLAKLNKIQFDDTVTVGFKKINVGAVIGICHSGLNFREIDLDIDYWMNSDHFSKLALVFHELTHCYCGRNHDYAKDKDYPEELQKRIEVALKWRQDDSERPGYWDDGCPITFMHPTVVDSDCVKDHYQQYVEEMFARCDPW